MSSSSGPIESPAERRPWAATSWQSALQALAICQELLQIAATAALAVYPWGRLVESTGLPPVSWEQWIAAVGVLSFWLVLQPTRTWLIGLPTLALILGLCAVQIADIYFFIVGGQLSIDYHILSSLIYRASIDILTTPPNLWWLPPNASYIRVYYDPWAPLFARLFSITSSPFGLLGYQMIALLGGAFVIWLLTQIRRPLRSFQVLLPVAWLMHPSLIWTVQTDYHTSGIGISVLLVGSYLFFKRRKIPAVVALLVGIATKISYWPCCLIFGTLSALRRDWRWAAAYFGIGTAAVLIHQLIQQQPGTPGASSFFGVSNPSDVVIDAIVHPDHWLERLITTPEWQFFVWLSAPFGFLFAASPLTLTPTLPLIGYVLLDQTGYRSQINFFYSSEFLGFLMAGTLITIDRAKTIGRLVAPVAVTIGTIAAFQQFGMERNWSGTYRRATMFSAGYFEEVAFATCATGGESVLMSSPQWSTYARGVLDSVWFDNTGGMGKVVDDETWRQFGTLVYPSDPHDLFTLSKFPVANFPYDYDHYIQLLERLPVSVKTPRNWVYRGSSRLAACADQFGYAVSNSPGRVTPAGEG